MKLFLRDEVFHHSHLKLGSLFSAALERAHRIELDDSGPLFQAWLKARSPEDRDEIQRVLDSSVEAEAREPTRVVLEVANTSESSWTTSPPVVTVADAATLAWQPFRVLVENATSDRAFFLSVANSEQRKVLERAEREKTLEFVQAGGIEQVTAQLRNDAARAPGRRCITFVFVDGDGLWHGQPSAPALTVRETCREVGVPCHVLKRRTIENYLPAPSLQAWAAERPNRGRTDRASLLSAYMRMTRARRWYFHLKGGFAKRHACRAYASVPQQDFFTLWAGFGSELSLLFIEGKVLNSDLRREGALRELQPVLDHLIALLR